MTAKVDRTPKIQMEVKAGRRTVSAARFGLAIREGGGGERE